MQLISCRYFITRIRFSGGEENKHQEAIERLLQEALETEYSSMDKSESKHFYFPTNTLVLRLLASALESL